MGWLLRQADRAGIRVIEALPHSATMLSVKGIRFLAVTFDGLMVVDDPIACEAGLRGGIGREKAFGCGLLSVRRVQ